MAKKKNVGSQRPQAEWGTPQATNQAKKITPNEADGDDQDVKDSEVVKDKKTDVADKKDKKEKGKKVVSFKEFDPSKFVEINPVSEAVSGPAVISFGRMNPMTSGHEKLVDAVVATAKKFGGDPLVYLSHSQDKKKNPLSYKDKISFAKKAFGKTITTSKSKNILQVAGELEGRYKDLIVVVGSDRVSEFDSLLNKYNGKEYTFDSIKVISAGERDPDAEGVEGMSASKMRKVAAEGDFDAFVSGLPKKLKGSAKKVFDAVTKGLNESLEEYKKENPMIMKLKGKKVELLKTGSSFKPTFTLTVDGKKEGKFGSEKDAMKHFAKMTMESVELDEVNLHVRLDHLDGDRRQEKAVSVLKKHEKAGHIKFDGETDKGISFKAKSKAYADQVNKDLKPYAATADIQEAGLWDNIHAKRKRIKNGSGEKMRKPGSKGAPTNKDFKDAQEAYIGDKGEKGRDKGNAGKFDKDTAYSIAKKHNGVVHKDGSGSYLVKHGRGKHISEESTIRHKMTFVEFTKTPIDELSKKKLSRYIDKAKDNKDSHLRVAADYLSRKGTPDSPKNDFTDRMGKAHSRKAKNHAKGIDRASKRLNREDDCGDDKPKKKRFHKLLKQDGSIMIDYRFKLYQKWKPKPAPELEESLDDLLEFELAVLELADLMEENFKEESIDFDELLKSVHEMDDIINEEEFDESTFEGSVIDAVLPWLGRWLDTKIKKKAYAGAIKYFLKLRKKQPGQARKNLVKTAQVFDLDVRALDKMFRDLVANGAMPPHLIKYHPTYKLESYDNGAGE